MNEQAIQIAMAMADGEDLEGATHLHNIDESACYERDGGIFYISLYRTDNEIDRMVRGLDDEKTDRYGYEIYLICERDYNKPQEYFGVFDERQTHRALPAQKVEAYLKAIGSWVEDTKEGEPLPVRSESAGSAIKDDFRGGNAKLKNCIKALIEMSDGGIIVPHGLGGHARTMLAACYHRLPNKEVCPSLGEFLSNIKDAKEK